LSCAKNLTVPVAMLSSLIEYDAVILLFDGGGHKALWPSRAKSPWMSAFQKRLFCGLSHDQHAIC